MKTFRESLVITKNFNILKNVIIELASAGEDPEKFLDWYVEEGLTLQKNNLLLEGFSQWVVEEGIWSNFADRWISGKKLGQNIKNNFSGLNNFGKRLGSAAQSGGEFIGRQVGKARDAYDSFSSGVAGTPPENRNSQQNNQQTSGDPQMRFAFDQRGGDNQNLVNSARTALDALSKRYNLSKDLQTAINDERFGEQLIQLINMLKNLRLENSIKEKLFILSSSGLNINELVDWFEKEKININEGIGNWLQKAGNWLGNQWQNLKHSWNNWGEGDKNSSLQKNKVAVDNAFKALSALKQKYGSNVSQEFSGVLDVVLDKVKSINQSQTQQTAQNTQQQQQDQPQQQQDQPQQQQDQPQQQQDQPQQQQDQPQQQQDQPQQQQNSIGSNVSNVGFNDKDHSAFQYVGKIKPQKLIEPKPPFVKRDKSFGYTPGIDVKSPASTSQPINASTEYNLDNDKFLESLLPKENKFSWFGY
jgi:hypothetical protein